MSLLYKKSSNVKELNHNHFSVSNINKKTHPNSPNPIIIKYYAHWCPHCHNPEMVEFLESLGEVLPKKTNITVAAFNCDFNDKTRDIAQNIGIQGFPTIRYYNKNGKESEYKGPREIKPFLQFLLNES